MAVDMTQSVEGDSQAKEIPRGLAELPTLPVTLAVCTANRPESLARTLRSLEAQRPPAREILVVDNGSDSATAQLIARDFPQVRLVRAPIPGLDFARNRAVQEARSDVLIFLDDDAVADPDWAATIAETMSEPSVGACTGRVEPLMLESAAQKMFEANGGFSRGVTSIRLPRDRKLPLHGRRAPLIAWAVSVGSGCSLAVRRDAVRAIGGFDEALDLGSALPGGGDHDILWRLLQAGYQVVYEPRAVARHEHRREWGAAEAQIVGHQRALIALLSKQLIQTRGAMRWSIAAFLGWRLVKPGVRLAQRVLGRDPLPASLLLRMWGQCWSGLWAYPRARAIARERVARAGRTAASR
jgi:GT2 family glycosyltransferase